MRAVLAQKASGSVPARLGLFDKLRLAIFIERELGGVVKLFEFRYLVVS